MKGYPIEIEFLDNGTFISRSFHDIDPTINGPLFRLHEKEDDQTLDKGWLAGNLSAVINRWDVCKKDFVSGYGKPMAVFKVSENVAAAH